MIDASETENALRRVWSKCKPVLEEMGSFTISDCHAMLKSLGMPDKASRGATISMLVICGLIELTKDENRDLYVVANKAK